MLSPAEEVEAIEVRLFLEAIYERYGYDLRGYAQPSMSRRVLAALARSGCRHLGDLQHRVLEDPALFSVVVEDLTVRLSDMFRDPAFYRSFRKNVVPVLRTYPFLKIWHCGCATGEEVYACAILLIEEGLYERSQIYATDLSVQALENARLAVYPEERLAKFTANYEAAGGTSTFASYYTAAYDGIALRKTLQKNILFFQHDLVSDHVFGEMNVVFCRNVLIYFGAALRERVLDKLAGSLCPGGFLCLGNSERVRHGTEASTFTEFAPEDRIYRHEA